MQGANATVGIRVQVPWRYGDEEPMAQWLVPLIKDLLPTIETATVNRICSLEWCYIFTNNKLRRRLGNKALFESLVTKLARMLILAVPAVVEDAALHITEDDRVLNLQHLLEEELPAYMADCSRPPPPPATAQESQTTPGEKENEDVPATAADAEAPDPVAERKLVLQRSKMLSDAKARLSKLGRKDQTKGLDGGLVYHGWTVELVEGRAQATATLLMRFPVASTRFGQTLPWRWL